MWSTCEIQQLPLCKQQSCQQNSSKLGGWSVTLRQMFHPPHTRWVPLKKISVCLWLQHRRTDMEPCVEYSIQLAAVASCDRAGVRVECRGYSERHGVSMEDVTHWTMLSIPRFLPLESNETLFLIPIIDFTLKINNMQTGCGLWIFGCVTCNYSQHYVCLTPILPIFRLRHD